MKLRWESSYILYMIVVWVNREIDIRALPKSAKQLRYCSQ